MLTGKQLKVERIIRDIEAKNIAKHIGVSKSYISLMEKGERKISEEIFKKWIQYLGIN